MDALATALGAIVRDVVREELAAALADLDLGASRGPELLTLDEVGERLRCSKRQAERLVASRRLRVVRPSGDGGRPLVKASELERFIEEMEG